MTGQVWFPRALKIGLAGLTAALLLSVQVKITAQQSNASRKPASIKTARASGNFSIAIACRAITRN